MVQYPFTFLDQALYVARLSSLYSVTLSDGGDRLVVHKCHSYFGAHIRSVCTCAPEHPLIAVDDANRMLIRVGPSGRTESSPRIPFPDNETPSSVVLVGNSLLLTCHDGFLNERVLTLNWDDEVYSPLPAEIQSPLSLGGNSMLLKIDDSIFLFDPVGSRVQVLDPKLQVRSDAKIPESALFGPRFKGLPVLATFENETLKMRTVDHSLTFPVVLSLPKAEYEAVAMFEGFLLGIRVTGELVILQSETGQIIAEYGD